MDGDIILFETLRNGLHCGVYIGDGDFLHSTEITGSCIEKISSWQSKILAVYRLCV